MRGEQGSERICVGAKNVTHAISGRKECGEEGEGKRWAWYKGVVKKPRSI